MAQMHNNIHLIAVERVSNLHASKMASENIEEFQKVFQNSKFIVVLTGAGISAESGVPTFRGDGGFWRGYSIESLASMKVFKENPSLVWELYHYRRENVLPKKPNAAHQALTECQSRLEGEGKKLVIITQNIDELHTRAGSKDVIELHGTLFKTSCMDCGIICENYESPICPALEGKGAKEMGTDDAGIPLDKLPRCTISECGGLLRPFIVWFDEDPTDENMALSYEWLNKCDLMLIIGTSSLVEPANEFAPYAISRGVPVAEFNIEKTPATKLFQFHIPGLCGTTLPDALEPS